MIEAVNCPREALKQSFEKPIGYKNYILLYGKVIVRFIDNKNS
mgnify:CR=1 FL=1|tara:strand:+ start:98 stop:226 length:129 start_codon:yes stop_codon:yes gene_type:complete